MISSPILILTLLLTTFCDGLLHHQQQNVNLTYYEAMMARESQLRSSLNMIFKQIQLLNNTLTQMQGLPSMQIVALEDTIADENNILRQIADNHTLPFKLKSINCTNVTQDNVTELQNMINSVEKNLSAIRVELDAMNSTNQTLYDNMDLQYKWAYTYLSNLKFAAGQLSKCPYIQPVLTPGIANISYYSNISNLGVQNWIYGAITPTQYNIQLFKFISTYNYTICGKEAPFVLANQQVCSQCISPNGVFDVSQRKCVSGCPAGTFLDQSAHICVKRLCQFAGQVYNQTQDRCYCPNDRPFLTEFACVSCKSPMYWNQTSKNCQSCQLSLQQYYDNNLKVCAVCPPTSPISTGLGCAGCNATSYYDQSRRICISCPLNKLFNPVSNNCQCPAQNPFFDGQNCVKCDSSAFYNKKTARCEVCPQGTVYHPLTNECVPCPEWVPISNGTHCLSCPQNQVYDRQTRRCKNCGLGQIVIINDANVSVCTCPQSHYFDGTQCVLCLRPQLWNQITLTCESCKPGTIYSIQTDGCTRCPKNQPLERDGKCTSCPNNSYYSERNNSCIACYQNSVLNQQKSSCQCISGFHYNQTTRYCTDCGTDLIYNATTNTCTRCPRSDMIIRNGSCYYCPNNTFYDSSMHVCVGCSEDRYYNTTSKTCQLKCVGGSVYDNTTKQCKCPLDKPYTNGITCFSCDAPLFWDSNKRGCVGCQNFTFFNQTTKQCQKCPPGSILNSNTKKCQPCPNNTVYVENQNKCKACPNNSYVINNKCMVCANGTIYDSDRKQCLSCPPNTQLNAAEKRCVPICIGGRVYNQVSKACQCLASAPYWNGYNCVRCDSPSFWDASKKSCLQCPKNAYFNQITKKCFLCPNGSLYVAELHKCQYNKTVNKCPENTHYNAATNQCFRCPTGTTFDPSTSNCKYTIVTTTNITNVTKVVNCSERPTTPFWDGKTCVSCYLPNYWNHDNLKCQSCPSGQNYDIKNKICVKCNPGTTFDLNKYTCVWDGGINGTSTTSTTTTTTTTSTSSTSSGSSGSSGSNSNIVEGDIVPSIPVEETRESCVLPRYWNIDKNQCQSCPNGQNYDVSVRKCRTCENGTTFNFSTFKCQ